MIRTWRFAVVYLFLCVAAGYLHVHTESAVPIVTPLSGFPTRCNSWHMVSESRFSDAILEVLRPTDYISRNYVGANGTCINLYVGYHDGSRQSGEIHSPRHCLPGSGWQVISSERLKIPTDKGELNLTRAVYQKGEIRELFLYWFQVQNKTLASEYALKLAELANSLLYQRRDAAFIRISIPLEGKDSTALATGEAFIRDIYPQVMNHLPL
jgi:EpsI family protein